MRRLTRWAVGLLILVFGLPQVVTAQGPLKTIETVKVGCLFPFTGPAGLYGRDSIEAMKIAQDDLAASDQPGYPRIKILTGDTRSRALRAVQIARGFIEKDRVDFLCGVVSSEIALAVTELSRKHKRIFVGTDHASPRLVTEALHPYYFRVSNGTRQSMRAGARYIASDFTRTQPIGAGPIKFAFIGPDYDYGYRAWADLRAFLIQEKVAFKVVGEWWPKLFERDYSYYINEIQKVQADIVINGLWGQDLVTFIRQARLLGLFDNSKMMNFDAGGNYETLAALGENMPLGLVMSARHHVNWPETDANRSFVQKFFDRTGRYPSYSAHGAYSGILAIAEVVRKAGGKNDVLALVKAFEQLQIKLPEDPPGFASRMDPTSHQMQQAMAIGETVLDSRFPPAKVMLGNWRVFLPDGPPR